MGKLEAHERRNAWTGMAAPSVQASASPELTIVVDDRERASGLTQAVVARWPKTVEARLLVGDVEIGARVIVERKSLPDFVASVRDGRLFDQAYALNRAAARPLLVLEGTEPTAILGLSPVQFHGVLLTLMISFRVPVLRTSTIDETAAVIARVALREARWLARRAAPQVPRRARQTLDVLTSIPGIGDERAPRLLDAFGNVAGVVAAKPDELRSVPGIGRETARTVRSTLGVTASASERSASTPAPPSAPPST